MPPHGGPAQDRQGVERETMLFNVRTEPPSRPPPSFHISITQSATSFYCRQGASGVAQPFSFPDSLIGDVVTLWLKRIDGHVWILRDVNPLFKREGAGESPGNCLT